jgi:hypothetical protein
MDIIPCNDSFFKLKRIFILKAQHKLKLSEIHVYNIFWCFYFKCVALKIMNFEDVSLTKVIYFVWYRAWMHNINDI